MSEYLIQEETLTAIADAIRYKSDSTDTIDVINMAEMITNLKTTATPFGVMLATGTITPAEDIINNYTISTGLSVSDIPENIYIESTNIGLSAVVALDESMETTDISNLYNSIILSINTSYGEIENMSHMCRITYGLGNTGIEVVNTTGSSFGRIVSVSVSYINLTSLSSGNNYTICLKAGHTYRWTLYGRYK